jgi:hypothetical protein
VIDRVTQRNGQTQAVGAIYHDGVPKAIACGFIEKGILTAPSYYCTVDNEAFVFKAHVNGKEDAGWYVLGNVYKPITDVRYFGQEKLNTFYNEASGVMTIPSVQVGNDWYDVVLQNTGGYTFTLKSAVPQ